MASIPKDLQSLDADTQTVAHAMALLWTWRPRTTVYQLLQKWGVKSHAGKAVTQATVKEAWDQLRRAGLLIELPNRPGYARLHDSARGQAYRELLAQYPIAETRRTLYSITKYDPRHSRYSWPLWEDVDTIAILRLAVFSGAPISELAGMEDAISRRKDWGPIFHAACVEAFDHQLMERVAPEWRWEMALYALSSLCHHLDPGYLPFFHWTLDRVKTGQEFVPGPLRLQLAEVLLHRGEFDQMMAVLNPIENDATAKVLHAGIHIHQGQWAQAQSEMETAFKTLRKETGLRTRFLPHSLAWLYPLSLLAQQTPKHLELARKFCIGEAGSRTPSAHDFWGIWVHAANVRLGDTTLEPSAFHASAWIQQSWVHFERALLRAWLRPELNAPAAHYTPDADYATSVAKARMAFQACGFSWLDAQFLAAEKAFRNEDPGIPFFVAGGQEAWRNVLASLQSLANDVALTPDAHETRLLWSIQLGPQGTVETIEPLEQKRGPRGWGKPKVISLAKIAGNERLAPWDAQVARAIRKSPYVRSFWLDRAAALLALIGHPAVILPENPDTLVDVVEGTPEIIVSREGDRYVMRVEPKLQMENTETSHGYASNSEEKREREALRLITVIRDSPQQLRVIRLTPAQRRAAQLLAEPIPLPAGAQPELQQTLQALASHFQVQSDHAQAAREITAESHLRAELSPAGDGLLLRLVVAPLGVEGPRFAPGHGHQQVMAAIKGETVGTRRQLEVEKEYLDAVLDALPFLPPPGRADLVCEWAVEDPEEALTLVERLPQLEAVAAIDWPRGKAVRVQTIGVPHLQVAVGSRQDWFVVKGSVTLDEGLVLDLQTLLEAAQSNSRFLPMGEGKYAALTRELRERLQDLGAVAEHEKKKGGLRVPPLAASWLNELLNGTAAELDGGFRDRIHLLQAAQDLQPDVPTDLQAVLRPYQEEGYLWAMRLAEAGFGACLADDMGLGKTLQAIALLLARALGGPALVVAPTSVCGNWQAELERFAPSLQVLVYGVGDRSTILETAGPRDVVIVSYTLLQQAQAQFAARRWHSVVVDEAQAIKNATTKRSQSLFELPADFRLALSGTPVENRLAELWSIMRFCNPGLLGPLSRFNERFATPIERDRNRDAQRLLRRLVAPFLLRRTKSQVLQDLPPRTEMTLSLTPEPEEAAHYEALRRQALAESEELLQNGEGQAQFHILAQLTRLRRAACDPRLVSPDLGIMGTKVKAFAHLATELAENGHKTLVFSQFVDFLTLLRAPLDEAKIAYQYLDGSTPAAERDRRVAAFQSGNGHLFLISLKAGGFGLNLTAADYVIIADPWWNPAAEDQAAGRAHRIGQQRPVTVYRLVTQGTLEEKIVALHQEKRALAEGVLTDGGEGVALPSTDELLSLMREVHMPRS